MNYMYLKFDELCRLIFIIWRAFRSTQDFGLIKKRVKKSFKEYEPLILHIVFMFNFLLRPMHKRFI